MDKWRGSANYAYKLKLSKKTTFSIGLNASLLALRINTNKATTIESGDPTVPSMGSSKIFPNAGLGFYLKSTRWYLGASLPELIKNDFYSKENNGLGDLMIRQERHLFVMGGYTVKLSKMLKLVPNIQLKYIKNAPFDFDANLSLLIADKVTLGATYRLGDSADMLVHWNINDRIHAGVSYDFTLTKLQQVNKGSVEVMVGYDFYNSGSRLVNPRFF
jgi:type IX secretion system PorP/SprF family membrane protein